MLNQPATLHLIEQGVFPIFPTPIKLEEHQPLFHYVGSGNQNLWREFINIWQKNFFWIHESRTTPVKLIFASF
jgi:hypothetical protein